jgi:hypothetical protein
MSTEFDDLQDYHDDEEDEFQNEAGEKDSTA